MDELTSESMKMGASSKASSMDSTSLVAGGADVQSQYSSQYESPKFGEMPPVRKTLSAGSQ